MLRDAAAALAMFGAALAIAGSVRLVMPQFWPGVRVIGNPVLASGVYALFGIALYRHRLRRWGKVSGEYA